MPLLYERNPIESAPGADFDDGAGRRKKCLRNRSTRRLEARDDLCAELARKTLDPAGRGDESDLAHAFGL
jgi:hypothetical protein